MQFQKCSKRSGGKTKHDVKNVRNELHSELEKREISRVSRRERLANSSLVGCVSELIGRVLTVLVPTAAEFWLKLKIA